MTLVSAHVRSRRLCSRRSRSRRSSDRPQCRNGRNSRASKGAGRTSPPMTPATAQLVVNLLGAYAALGAVFGVFFLWKWVARFDRAAANATWGFRVLVFPGIVLFWPLFLERLLRGRSRVEILR